MATIVDAPKKFGAWRHPQIEHLEPGQAFLVPWADLDRYGAGDGYHQLRSYVWWWGRRLGQVLGTKKADPGVYVVRWRA
jgi:hypothetical protein